MIATNRVFFGQEEQNWRKLEKYVVLNRPASILLVPLLINVVILIAIFFLSYHFIKYFILTSICFRSDFKPSQIKQSLSPIYKYKSIYNFYNNNVDEIMIKVYSKISVFFFVFFLLLRQVLNILFGQTMCWHVFKTSNNKLRREY